MLSTCQPFPWSRLVWEGVKTVFNLVPCDNDFERDFAKFLDDANDVTSVRKLPRAFGFSIEYTDGAMNLRSYFPDFVAVDDKGIRWLLETKGAETDDVALQGCSRYPVVRERDPTDGDAVAVPEGSAEGVELLQPSRLADLKALQPAMLF